MPNFTRLFTRMQNWSLKVFAKFSKIQVSKKQIFRTEINFFFCYSYKSERLNDQK